MIGGSHAASPVLVLVGGIDPSGGAGLVRDLCAVRSLEVASPRAVDLACVPSAWTWQGHGEVARAQAVDRVAWEEALARARARAQGRRSVVKIGLVPESLCAALAKVLSAWGPDCVVMDPVLRASDGGDLGATATALRALFPLANLITPNRVEAQQLTDAAGGLVAGSTLALIKSASRNAHEVVDQLRRPSAPPLEFSAPISAGPDPRGTGCSLATAIAWHLACGASMQSSIDRARAWLASARTRVHPGPDGRAHLRVS